MLLLIWSYSKLVRNVSFFSSVTRKGTSSSSVFYIVCPQWRKIFLCFFWVCFFLSCCLQRERKKNKQHKVLKNAGCQLCCEITWRLKVNHCSMFSNLDFAKVTLKTQMLFAVFTAKNCRCASWLLKGKHLRRRWARRKGE